MSRKTKEQKKLAEYRRRLKLLQPTPTPAEKSQPDQSSITNYVDLKIQKKDLPEDAKNQQEFNQDLKKSLLFILLIITLEIVIYFARMNR